MKRYEYRLVATELPDSVQQWFEAVTGQGWFVSMDGLGVTIALEAETDFEAAERAGEINNDCIGLHYSGRGSTTAGWRMPSRPTRVVRVRAPKAETAP